MQSLRRQLDGTSEELTEVGRGREVALRENRRLQDDLATMTRENQVSGWDLVAHSMQGFSYPIASRSQRLHEDLDRALDEKEQLKTQVQDYITEVKRIEELLAAKVLTSVGQSFLEGRANTCCMLAGGRTR